MKTLLALLLLSTGVYGQGVYYVQCGPGGCCPPRYQYQQPQYYQPQQQRPSPDGVQTPQVGSPNTPQFQPLPPPPPATTPAIPPKPGFDWDSYDKRQKEILAAQEKSNEELHALSEAIRSQPICNCKPTDLTLINAKLDSLSQAITNIKVEAPAPAQPTAPASARRLYLRAVPIQ